MGYQSQWQSMLQRFENEGSSRHPEWTRIRFHNVLDEYETEARKKFPGASAGFIQYKAEKCTHRAAWNEPPHFAGIEPLRRNNESGTASTVPVPSPNPAQSLIQHNHNATGVTVQQSDIVALLAAQEEIFQKEMDELKAMVQQRGMFMEPQRNQFLDQQRLVQNQGLLENTSSQQTRITDSQDYLPTQLQQLSIQSIDRRSEWTQSTPNSIFRDQVPAQASDSRSIQTPQYTYPSSTSPPRRGRGQGPRRGTSQAAHPGPCPPRRERPLGPVRGSWQGRGRGQRLESTRGRPQSMHSQDHSSRYTRVPLRLQQRTWQDEPPRYVEPSPRTNDHSDAPVPSSSQYPPYRPPHYYRSTSSLQVHTQVPEVFEDFPAIHTGDTGPVRNIPVPRQALENSISVAESGIDTDDEAGGVLLHQ